MREKFNKFEQLLEELWPKTLNDKNEKNNDVKVYRYLNQNHIE